MRETVCVLGVNIDKVNMNEALKRAEDLISTGGSVFTPNPEIIMKAYENDSLPAEKVNWFAVAGVILGAIVANVLNWGISSINGMMVAVVCYLIGYFVKKNQR